MTDDFDAEQARAALDKVAAARARIAELGVCPPWRHAAFGAILSLLVLGPGLSHPLHIATLPLAMGLMVWILMWDRRRYGMFINGYRRGATLPLTMLLLIAMGGLLVWQIHMREQHAAQWVAFAIAGLAFAVGTGASVWWASIFRREMGA
jgi:hypothetical protein